jgi:hypothetical protein
LIPMSTAFVMVETGWARTPEEAVAEVRQLDARLEVNNPLAGNRNFFAGKSLAQLAREQGVGPVEDIGVFAGGIPEDEDVDAMLNEIYRLREA